MPDRNTKLLASDLEEAEVDLGKTEEVLAVPL